MFYVYLLKSEIDGKYYIGQTDDISARLVRHNQGFVPATRARRPFVLIGYESFESCNQARFREHELKHNTNERNKFYNNLDKARN